MTGHPPPGASNLRRHELGRQAASDGGSVARVFWLALRPFDVGPVIGSGLTRGYHDEAAATRQRYSHAMVAPASAVISDTS